MSKPYIFHTPLGEIVLGNTFARCTKCGELKPMEEVGLRMMDKRGSSIRRQPQCMTCRGKKDVETVVEA